MASFVQLTAARKVRFRRSSGVCLQITQTARVPARHRKFKFLITPDCVPPVLWRTPKSAADDGRPAHRRVHQTARLEQRIANQMMSICRPKRQSPDKCVARLGVRHSALPLSALADITDTTTRCAPVVAKRRAHTLPGTTVMLSWQQVVKVRGSRRNEGNVNGRR